MQPDFAFYYPGQRFQNVDWIKNLICFFDGIAMLIPEAPPNYLDQYAKETVWTLENHELFRVIRPEEVVDAEATETLAEAFGNKENRSKPIIVNMSLGFKPEYLSKSEQKALMIGIRGFISTLVEDFDILPVVAIGNGGPGSVRAPGYFPETLSVGAIDYYHKPARFSGGGLSPIDGEVQPDIAGYGVDIFSSLGRDINNRSLYKYMSGTSMAAPYVAGIAALYASTDAKLQGKALRQHLINTALPLYAPTDRVGAGLARFTENGNKKA